MRKRTMLVFACVAGLSTVAPSTAQAQDKPVHVSLGGGWTAPNSEVADRLGQGYNFNFGIDVAVNPVVAIEGLYSFNGLGEKEIAIGVAPCEGCATTPTNFFGNMNMQYGTVSAIFQRPEGGVRPYGLMGMGIYYRPHGDHHPRRRLGAWLLRSVVVRVLSRWLGRGGQDRW